MELPFLPFDRMQKEEMVQFHSRQHSFPVAATSEDGELLLLRKIENGLHLTLT